MKIKCPECKSEDVEHYIGIPEITSNTVIAGCNNCGYNMTNSEIYGKSIFDKPEFEKKEKVSGKRKLPDDENKHHLFSYYEIKHNLMQIFGEPKNDEEHNKLDQEIAKIWRLMPKYRIKKTSHTELHKNICEKCGRSFGMYKKRLQKQ